MADRFVWNSNTLGKAAALKKAADDARAQGKSVLEVSASNARPDTSERALRAYISLWFHWWETRSRLTPNDLEQLEALAMALRKGKG